MSGVNKKRIIFVDDEANVIDGLRRLLRKDRHEWEMTFVDNGADALSAMAQSPFDVIVTDIMMPGMDGAELLERVVRDHPDVARIVLTGHAGDEAAAKLSKLAHQFLAKPVDANQLREAVARACAVGKSVDDETIRAVVGGCKQLPSLPTLCAEITKAVESEDASAKQIAAIISQDMSMSAKLLQLVNSSFFGLGRRVSSIEQAVALLGTVRIKALVLSESIFKQFKPSREPAGFSIDTLWRHSLQVAGVARRISKEEGQGGDRPDQAFTAGVLHDLGQLLFVCYQIERFEGVLDRASGMGTPLWRAETDLLGVSHGQIGGYLLDLWGLPPRIVEAVELHHTPSNTSYDGLCALTVVHVADVLASEFEQGRLPGVPVPSVDMTYLERTGLSARLEHWRGLAAEACEQAMEPQT